MSSAAQPPAPSLRARARRWDDAFFAAQNGTLTILPPDLTGNDADLETWPVQRAHVSSDGLPGTRAARVDGAYDCTLGAAVSHLKQGEIAYDILRDQAMDAAGAIDQADAGIAVAVLRL